MTTISHRRPSASSVLWAKLAAAAVLWVLACQVNEPLWTWLIGDVAHLDLSSRLGSGIPLLLV